MIEKSPCHKAIFADKVSKLIREGTKVKLTQHRPSKVKIIILTNEYHEIGIINTWES